MNNLKDRIIKNIKNNKILLLVFSLIWIACIVATLFVYKPTLGKEPVGGEDYAHTFEVFKNRSLTQILPVEDGSSEISVRYATYIRNNKGNMFVKVVGVNSNEIYLDTKTSVKSMQDNSYVTYELNETLDKTKDELLEITFTSDSKQGSCAGIYYSFDSFFEDSKMTLNDNGMPGELAVKYLINNETYKTFSNGVVTAIIISFTLIILALLLIEPQIEKTITLMIIVFGLVFACIMSPGAIPDENTHYETSLMVSNLMMGKIKTNNEIDKAYVNYDSFGSFKNANYSYNRFMRDMNKPLKLKDKVYEIENDWDDIFKHYYFAPYIPQAIGITLSRIFNTNTLRTYYAGRVFNLFFYAACIYFALKVTPVHKLLFGLLSMLPIFIQQAASHSYDTFVFGLTFISIAYFMKWYFSNEEIKNKDVAVLFVVNLALAPVKIVYGLFALLFAIVPTSRFGSLDRKIKILVIISVPTLGYILVNIWWRIKHVIEDLLGIDFKVIYADTFNTPVKSTADITGFELNGGTTYSFGYIVANPGKTISLLVRSVRFWLSTWFYQSLGKALAGVTLILPMTYVRIVLILIGISALRKEDYEMTWFVRGSFVVVCLGVAALILLGMLVGWTLTTDTLIQGIQGRYFCPLLPYFFSMFNNKYIKLPKKIDKYVLFTYTILMFEVVIYVLSYTFVN